MWTPKQLLNTETVRALEDAGFTSDRIEFLGWMSGVAQALNKSKNPAKAAFTMLARPKIILAVKEFIQRKKDSVVPRQTADTAEADLLFRRFESWDQTTNDPEAEERQLQVEMEVFSIKTS